MTILILGGTVEARKLAQNLADQKIIYSLAGATDAPRLPANAIIRKGGFGGARGLADFLKAQKISHVIDATHPFAKQMSVHAVAACMGLNVPLTRYERPAWNPEAGDHWITVPTTNAAFDEITLLYKRPLLALGIKETAEFRQIGGQTVYLRSFNEPTSLPAGWHWVPTEHDATVDSESSLLRLFQIDVMVCRNSGGNRAKLDAARDLRLPVVMIERPALPQAETVERVDEVLERLS